MKSIGKKMLAWVLAVLMTIGACSVIQFTNQTLQVSAYAAHTQQEAVNWAISQIGQKLDYDGVYGAQCVDLIKYYYAYLGVSPVTGNGADYAYNSLPAGWTRIQNYSGFIPQPGDIAVWTGGYGHVSIVTSSDSVGFNSINQNVSGTDGSCMSLWKWNTEIWGVIRPDFPSSSQLTVSYSDVKTTMVDSWNADLYGVIHNPSRATISQVGFTIWNSDGKQITSHTEDCGLNYSTIYQTNNIVADQLPGGLESGHSYTFQLWAVANGTTSYSDKISFTTVDDKKPVISNVQISNVTADSYTVTCDIYENSEAGLNRVQFPTWTPYNDQDDIADSWATNSAVSGSLNRIDTHNYTATFRVVRSQHNNEVGEYYTHIYAYDTAGNRSDVARTSCRLTGNVTSISIVTTPMKTEYYVGESFDSTGLVLRATYQDGSTETVTSGYTITAASFSTPGTKTVRFTYQNRSVSTLVTVHKRLPFVDVPASGVYYSDAVQYVYDYDYMTGMNPTTFGPAENLSRAQFAVILYRMKGSPSTAGMNNPFEDNQPGTFYYDAVIWCNNAGIITGYYNADGSFTGRFGPSDNISREQLATMLYRYANYVGDDTSAATSLNRFGDAAMVSSYAVDALEWAAAEGIVSGRATNPPTIAPLDNASRADVAVMLQRYLV